LPSPWIIMWISRSRVTEPVTETFAQPCCLTPEY
jgi:hypothetical protein